MSCRGLLAGVSGLFFCFWYRRPGSGKRVFSESPLSRDSREFRDLEILENPQAVANKGECNHLLEVVGNLEILEIVESPVVKRPLS